MIGYDGFYVAEVLGYSKPLNAIAMHVDKDDSLKWGLIDSKGRNQQAIFINESGLYSLVLSSKLIEAHAKNDMQNKAAFVRLTSMVRDYTDSNGVVHYNTEMRLTNWELL